tara:strand:+ start:142 stop:816 length:675 start_codon:yes stop_codon:yes gene_type:complete
MKGKNHLILWLVLFIFLTTFSYNLDKKEKHSILPIKIINIEGIINSNEKELNKNLEKLKGKSLIFISRNIIKESINDLNFIKEIKVKKIYPDTIKIIVVELKPLGNFINKDSKFLILESGDLIENSSENKFDKLPIILGYGAEKKFHIFYQSLMMENFEIDIIKEFNYFKINRWDIVLKDGKIIKLPINKYEDSIKEFLSIYKKKDYYNFKVFDFRIKGQLILK